MDKVRYAIGHDVGRLSASGFYSKRFPCPKHGGKDKNASLHKHGFIYCHSQCGKISINEVLALYGINSPRMTKAEHDAYAQTRKERERELKRQHIKRLAYNQIATAVREGLAGMPIDMYDEAFEPLVAYLGEQWLAGKLKLDLKGASHEIARR